MEYDPDWETKVRPDKTLGYPYFTDKSHPLASKRGKVYVHRHVASLMVGRWLTRNEHVHHRNHNRLDYRPENLEIMTASEHHSKHGSERVSKPLPLHPCRACGRSTTNAHYCDYECSHKGQRKVERPNKETLSRLLETHSMVAVGKMFGVSDNAVRKWMRQYNEKL